MYNEQVKYSIQVKNFPAKKKTSKIFNSSLKIKVTSEIWKVFCHEQIFYDQFGSLILKLFVLTIILNLF